MNKYLIGLAAPSLGLMNDPPHYIKPYVVESNTLEDLGSYVDEKLTRKFALEFNTALSDVEILFAAQIK